MFDIGCNAINNSMKICFQRRLSAIRGGDYEILADEGIIQKFTYEDLLNQY